MGSYSVLTVGQVVLQWKYRVPPFLSFLFDEQDFYSDIPEELGPCQEHERRVGYVTSAASAMRRLDEVGFTLPFFAGTYQLLDDEIDAWLLHVVGERLAEEHEYPEDVSLIDDLAAEHLRSFARGTALDDIHKFIGVLRESLTAKAHPAILKLSDARRPGAEKLAIDLEELWYDLDQNALRLDPGVLRVGQLLSESSFEDFPEVAWLLFLRLLSRASKDAG